MLRRASICPYADTHPDACPNQLTPMRDCLNLVDGGFAINSPFPLSLLPQRAVDLIVSFDYSLDAPFKVRGGGSLLRWPDWVCGDGPSRKAWVLICQWSPVPPAQHWCPGWRRGLLRFWEGVGVGKGNQRESSGVFYPGEGTTPVVGPASSW